MTYDTPKEKNWAPQTLILTHQILLTIINTNISITPLTPPPRTAPPFPPFPPLSCVTTHSQNATQQSAPHSCPTALCIKRGLVVAVLVVAILVIVHILVLVAFVAFVAAAAVVVVVFFVFCSS